MSFETDYDMEAMAASIRAKEIEVKEIRTEDCKMCSLPCRTDHMHSGLCPDCIEGLME